MLRPKTPIARLLIASAAILVGGSALSGCATRGYVDEQIALVNQRIDGVDARATDGIRRADAAAQAAQQAAQQAQAANAAAQAAATEARNAAGRIDQINTRVTTMEQQRTVTRTPRN